MKKYALGVALIVTLFIGQAGRLSASTLSELRAQVDSLLASVNELPGESVEELSLKIKLLTNALSLQKEVNRISASQSSQSQPSYEATAQTVGNGVATRDWTEPPVLSRDLRFGSTGNDVYLLQEWLTENGYMSRATINVERSTNTFGRATESAVTSFQEEQGILRANAGVADSLFRETLATISRARLFSLSVRVYRGASIFDEGTIIANPGTNITVKFDVPESFAGSNSYADLALDGEEIRAVGTNPVVAGENSFSLALDGLAPGRYRVEAGLCRERGASLCTPAIALKRGKSNAFLITAPVAVTEPTETVIPEITSTMLAFVNGMANRYDINGDGVVASNDQQLIINARRGNPCPSNPLVCDLTGDGKISSADVSLIAKYLTEDISRPQNPNDLNHDGRIDVADLQALINVTTGKALCPVYSCDLNKDGRVNNGDYEMLSNALMQEDSTESDDTSSTDAQNAAATRDQQRIEHLRIIETALERYYNLPGKGTYKVPGAGGGQSGMGWVAHQGGSYYAKSILRGLADAGVLPESQVALIKDPTASSGGGYMLYLCSKDGAGNFVVAPNQAGNYTHYALSTTLENPTPEGRTATERSCNGIGGNGTVTRYGKNYSLSGGRQVAVNPPAPVNPLFSITAGANINKTSGVDNLLAGTASVTRTDTGTVPVHFSASAGGSASALTFAVSPSSCTSSCSLAISVPSSAGSANAFTLANLPVGSYPVTLRHQYAKTDGTVVYGSAPAFTITVSAPAAPTSPTVSFGATGNSTFAPNTQTSIPLVRTGGSNTGTLSLDWWVEPNTNGNLAYHFDTSAASPNFVLSTNGMTAGSYTLKIKAAGQTTPASLAFTIVAPASQFTNSAGTSAVVSGAGQITLSWPKHPTYSRYNFLRYTVGLDGTTLGERQDYWAGGDCAVPNLETPSCVDTRSLVPGKTYRYLINAWNGDTAIVGWTKQAQVVYNPPTSSRSSQLANITEILYVLRESL